MLCTAVASVVEKDCEQPGAHPQRTGSVNWGKAATVEYCASVREGDGEEGREGRRECFMY